MSSFSFSRDALIRPAASCALACALIACGCSEDIPRLAPAPMCGGAPTADGFVPAVHARPPLIPYFGGPVLSHVELVTVTFANDPSREALESFGQWIVTSDWLAQVGGDYGAGLGTHRSIHLSQQAPSRITRTEIQSLLLDTIHADRAISSEDVLYMIYWPVNLSPAGLDYCGYHSSVHSAGRDIPFAVVTDCQRGLLSSLEHTASHELIEAATDPLPNLAPAYRMPSRTPWAYQYGELYAGEVADLCDQYELEISGFTVQRSWSNSAVANCQAPCAPARSGEVAFGVSIVPSGVRIDPGQTAIFVVTGWSNGPVPDWPIYAAVSASDSDPAYPPTLAAQMLNNGQQTELSFVAPATSPFATVILVWSDPSAGGAYWPVVVLSK